MTLRSPSWRRPASHAQPLRVVQMVTVPESLAFLRGQPAVFRASGFEVVCISSPGRKLDEFGVDEGVRVVPVQMERRIRPLHDLRSLIVLVARIRRLKPTVVHAHTPKAALLGMLAGWINRVPVRIFHVHGLPVVTARGLRRRVLLLTDRLSVRLAHRVLFVSHSLRIQAIQEGACPAEKAQVLGGGSANGVDAEGRFNPGASAHVRLTDRRQRGWLQTDFVVGYMGRLVHDKGVTDLLRAWDHVRRPGRRLLIVGPEERDDALPADVMARIRMDHDITWVPWTDEPEELLALMDVLVLPSYREGLGLSALEASAMGIPVVGTDIPGLRDAVVQGVTGTLVPTHDPDALRTAIEAYAEDADLRRAHGEAGRLRVLRSFRPEVVHQALIEEYFALMGQLPEGARHV